MSSWPIEWKVARVIRRHGDVAVLAAEGERVLVCAPKATHGASIEAMAASHRAVTSPLVPTVIDVGTTGSLAFVALSCDAVTDFEAVLHAASARGERVPYAQGIALNEFLMDSVEATHAHGPLGALAWSSMWVGPSGRLWLGGLGADLLARGPSRVEAPELRLHMPLTEASDVLVIHLLIRSLLPYVEMLPLFELAMKGSDERVRDALVEMSASVLSPDPALRPPSIAALRGRYRAMRAMAPDAIPPADEAGFSRTLARLVQTATASEQGEGPVSRVRLVVDERACRVRLPDGVLLDLSRRGAPWRIMRALAAAHLDRRGDGVSLEELRSAGWPTEVLIGTSGRARVYVAIATLRKLGLAPWLLAREGSYLLSADVEVEVH